MNQIEENYSGASYGKDELGTSKEPHLGYIQIDSGF